LELICSQPQAFPHLLIIGAYRNNEVDENHRVITMENAIAVTLQPLLKIQLTSLDRSVTNLMVSYIFGLPEQKTESLADIIYAFSAGNPLYITQSLYWLHHNKGISLSKEGVWSWDSTELMKLQLPNSVLALTGLVFFMTKFKLLLQIF